uniref:Cytochrome P450 n=1 Tax=Steinernema glaseri TaxID=37863 RepID=A0A1I7ZTC5_9BILA
MMLNILIVLVILLLYWIRSVRRKDLPPGPTPLPLLGNAHQLLWAYWRGRSHVDVFLEWKKVYGNVYTIYLGPYHCVLIVDYQTTLDAFIKNGEDHAGRNNTFIFNNPRNLAMMLNVLIILVILLFYWIRSVRRKDLPPGPTPLPLLGNAHQLLWAYWRGRSHVDVFLEWKKVYGNVYTIYLGPYHCVLIVDYQTTLDAFIKNGEDHAGRNNTFIFNNPRSKSQVCNLLIKKQRILEEFDYRAERLDKLFDENDGKQLILDPRSFFDLLITSIINRILVGYRYDDVR